MISTYYQVVPEWMREAFKRRVMLHMRAYGFQAERYADWQQNAWPELRDSDQCQAIVNCVSYALGMDPWPAIQIIWHLPDSDPGTRISVHTDVPDEGKVFTRIAGVALSDWTKHNGTLLHEAADEHWRRDLKPVELRAGDIFTMDPKCRHSAGINLSGEVRWGMYLRWQAPATIETEQP